ncbi:MAG: response regulator [Opitutaceae bacterium]
MPGSLSKPNPQDRDGRVLIMDDDADVCMISKGMLEFLGYDADTALHGGEAIQKFKHRLESGCPYLAVILDLTMAGGLGGVEVLQELKQLQPGVKTIVSSGYATPDNADKYRELGFSAILAKPYRSADMARALRQAIGEGGGNV